MNTGSFRSLASASARPKSSSMNGTTGFHAEALFAGAALVAVVVVDAAAVPVKTPKATPSAKRCRVRRPRVFDA